MLYYLRHDAGDLCSQQPGICKLDIQCNREGVDRWDKCWYPIIVSDKYHYQKHSLYGENHEK
jgi:hypothetical protein